MPWAFADPSNLAVMTTRQVVNEGKFINFVSHDEDDGGWQFHHATSSASLHPSYGSWAWQR
jgi:hypothetical protein